MLIFMIVILFLASFFILIFLILLYSAPCWYYSIREQFVRAIQGGDVNQEETDNIISKIKKQTYDPKIQGENNSCAICMCDFEEKDEITVLKCNPAHFYHSECIIRWIAE